MVNKPVVIVAEDQPHLLLTMEYLTRMVGNVEVMTTDNGEDAAKLAIEHKPALVLLDVMMPKMDGYAACQKIREAWGDHSGLIWLMSVRNSQADKDRIRQVGANCFINKPFDPDLIVQLMREALGINESPIAAAG